MKATKLLTLFVVPILLFQLGGCDAESGLEKTNKLPVVQNNEIADDIFSLERLELDYSISNPLYMDFKKDYLIIADMKRDAIEILTYDTDGKMVSETTLPLPATSQPNEVSGIKNLSYCENGIWGISYVEEMTAGGDIHQEGAKTELLTRYDTDGTVACQIKLSNDFVIQDVLAIDDGCLLVTDHSIIHYSLDGNLDWTIESDAFLSNLLYSSDGSIYCASLYDDGYVYKIDDELHTIYGPIISDCGHVNFLFACETMLLGCDETTIYQYNLSNGQLVASTDYNDLGIAAMIDAAPYKDGVAIIYQSVLGGKSLGILKNSTNDNIEEVLTIGVVSGENTGLLNGIIELFQLRNTSYRISIKEYEAIDNLATAILAGDAPDLICLKGLPTEEYARKGLLLDLYECIDPETLVSAYRQFELNGRLYSITPDFTLGVLFANPEIVPTSVSSFAEIQKYITASPGKIGYNEFASVMMAFSLSTFVDFEAGICNFNSQEFIALLDLCKTNNDTNSAETLPAIAPVEITAFAYYSEIKSLGMVEIGFPKGAAISRPTSNLIGIFARTEHKDVAQEFIKFMLSEELQKTIIHNGDSFPVVDAVFQSALDGDHEEVVSFNSLLKNVQGVDLSATELYQIVKSELNLFLEGVQTAEMTANNIQSRASIYLAEKH